MTIFYILFRPITKKELKKFKDKGGTSNKVANLPTIKFPDQNNAASVRKV